MNVKKFVKIIEYEIDYAGKEEKGKIEILFSECLDKIAAFYGVEIQELGSGHEWKKE